MSFHWKTSDGEARFARAWWREQGHGVLACVHGLSGEQIDEWFGKLGSTDKTLKVYSEAYHLFWHDHDKDTVLSDVGLWLKSRNGRTPRETHAKAQ